MGFGDLIRRAAVVESSGTRYVCRPPTLAAVVRAMDLYPGEAQLMRTLSTTTPVSGQEAAAVVAAMLTTRPDACAAVLATCVEPAPGPDEVAACTMAVLGLCDVDRIGRAIGRDMAHAKRASAEGDGAVALVLALSKATGADPITIANDWPYELVLTVAEQMSEAESDARIMKAKPGIPLAPGAVGRTVKKRPLVN